MALRTAGTDAAKATKRLFHFVEAICTWDHATAAGATQLHAHFGTTPSTVAMWAAEYARRRGEGPTRWSFSYHSASEMYDTAWALNRAKAASADVVVCVSDQTRSNLLRTCDPADWPKVQVVRLGIDLDDFAYREPPPPADPPTVIVVGRLAPEKGHLVLIDAMARLARAGTALHARIVGGGDLADTIAAAVRDAGLDDCVDLVGEVAPSDVRPLVESSDIFCLPTFDEGLPVSIMEAMATGVPVVTTYVNGIPELAVDGVTAMVVPAGNADALADALAVAATDTELRARLAGAARTAVETHHDRRDAVPAFIAAILDVAQRRRSLMRLFVTGASGFLGTAVRREALARGHEIVALTRSPKSADAGPATVTWVEGDICAPDTWRSHLAGVDAVIHLAASLDGAAADQLAVAVDGTRALVDAMADADVERLVHISSLAVYDLAALAVGDLVDETTPIEVDPARRDGYTAAKLAQDVEARRAPSVVLLRPGLLWDRDHHWNGGAALTLAGRLGVTIAPRARPALCHVDDCARAVVTAAERPEVTGVINLVDPAAPDRRTFAENLRADGVDLPSSIPVAYGAVDAIARAAWSVAGLPGVERLGLRSRLPGLLRPAQLAARAKPLRYSSQRAQDLLDW